MKTQNEPESQQPPRVKKRIAFFCIPAYGHTNPMLPVAAELTRRGHAVRFYSFGGTGGLPDFSDRIGKTGAEFVPCDAYMPEVSAEEVAGLKRVSITEMTVQAIRITLAMDAFLDAEFKSFQPDVVYTDSACFWGKLNAWKHQVPMVVSTSTFAFNRLSSQYMKHPPAEIADMVFGLPRIGKALKSMEPYGYKVKNPLSLVQSDNSTDSVVYTSRRFQPYAGSFSGHYAFVGPSVFSNAAPNKKKERPLVYISMGTVINDRPDFYNKCFEALKDLNVDVLISCGNAVDREKLGVPPENFELQPYVDQLDVLSRADAFITHCGMNSVSESLYMATPMVLYPQTGEQAAVAKRAAELGAGMLLKDDSVAGIRAAVQEILDHVSYRDAAELCRLDFRSCSGPSGAADFIESAPHRWDGVDVMKELNKTNTRFLIVYNLIAVALIVLVGLLFGWKYVWILGVAAGIASNPIGKCVQNRRYARLVKVEQYLFPREEPDMTTDAEPKTNWRRIIIWGSVLVFIILLPFLIDEPVCFYTYLNTKTLKSESFVRIGPMTFRKKDDPATLLDDCRTQGLLRPGETVRQEHLPEYWICTHKQSYTLLGSPVFHEVRGGKYPTKLRFFLMEHYQEMMDSDYKETEEEFSARFTDYILSLNGDEKFKGALLPADTDLRARSY